MNLHDVIKVIETERECVSRDCDRDCGKCDLVMDKNKILKAYDKVLKYLKSKECVTPYIDMDEYKCPACNVKLTRKEFFDGKLMYEDLFNYCPKCGRDVMWSRIFGHKHMERETKKE